MPPFLLLDAHFSDVVAERLRRHGFDVTAAQKDEAPRRLDDEALLEVAAGERRTIVTYNLKDFDLIGRRWALTGRSHWGIVLVHSRSINQKDLGGQIRALGQLLGGVSNRDGLRDIILFLEAS